MLRASLISLIVLCSFQVAAAESTLQEQGRDILNKIKEMRRLNEINFADDAAKNNFRDREDELSGLVDGIGKLEELMNSKRDQAFAKLAIYKAILSELVIGNDISGPILATANIEYDFSAVAGSILKEVTDKLGVVVGAGAKARFKSKDIQQIYQKARSAVLSQMAECAHLVGGTEKALADLRVREVVTYLRDREIVSQPECVNIFQKTAAAFDICT